VKSNLHFSLWGHANDRDCPDANESDYRYHLTGVIEHRGSRPDYGHYVCAMNGINTQRWYHFNDANVSPTSGLEAQKMEPYLAFYTKVSTEDVGDSSRPRSRSVSAPRNKSGYYGRRLSCPSCPSCPLVP